jgi:hypothetical protein
LSRNFGTVIEGKAIGADIPPLVTRRMRIRGTQHDRTELREILLRNERQLFRKPPKKKAAHESIKFDLRIVRLLMHATFFFPFQRGVPAATAIKPIRSLLAAEPDIKRHLRMTLIQLSHIEGVFLPWSEQDLNDEVQLPHDELITRVAGQSPKLQALGFEAATRVLAQERKLVIWTSWPWHQLLVEVYLKAFGIDTRSLHASLKQRERDALVEAFTMRANEAAVFVGSYEVSSSGVNLQKRCFTTICIEPASSGPRQDQAIARASRIGQTREQYVTFYELEESKYLLTYIPFFLINQF